MAPLMLTRLKHVQRLRDRHGTVRHYLRVPGLPRVTLPGEPGSREFLAAYAAAMATAKPPAGATRTVPGSLNDLAVSWFKSAAYRALAASTQATYRRISDKLRAGHGDKPVRLLDQQGVKRLLEEVAGHPTAPGHLLRVIRAMMAHAIDKGMIANDPSEGVKRPKHRATGYRTWTEEEIAKYEAHWPSGSKPRLALALLLYTGQRRSDVVRMGRQHVTDGRLAITQQKTGNRLLLPIHPALAAELAQVPADRLTFLVRESGGPHTGNGFYNAFVEWCAAAGLPAGLAPHGLRKAQGRRLAEAGATANEIAAVLGHQSLSEVQVYTQAAEQKRLADAGMGKITNISVNPKRRVYKNRSKTK